MDIANLQAIVQCYYHQGLATSTQKSYQAGQRYLTFCGDVKRSPIPASEDTLLMFVGHLAQQGLAHQTNKVYLSAVCNLHVTAGLHNKFAKQLTPRLEMVLKGTPQHNNLQAIIRLLIIRGNIITERYTGSAGANALIITCLFPVINN